jgi:pectin methylesterase-like acyl-CoA thioesterase
VTQGLLGPLGLPAQQALRVFPAQWVPWAPCDRKAAKGDPGGNVSYKNLIVVAKSGAAFTSVQAALDSITDAAANNRYLVYVAPGEYAESVAMKSYVDIQGAGESVTRLVFPGAQRRL